MAKIPGARMPARELVPPAEAAEQWYPGAMVPSRVMRGYCRIGGGVVVLLAVACSVVGGTSRPPVEREVVVSSGTVAGGSLEPCEGAERVVTSVRYRKPGRLVGDVDGDGNEDRVFVAVDERARRGCGAFVAVDTGDRLLAAPIADDFISFELGLPTLKMLASINLVAGSEIVVDVSAGASTQFAAVFTVVAGRLSRVTVPGASNPLSFAYGGSVGHVAGIDCQSDGRIVISSATPRRARYRLTRRFADARGTEWGLDRAATERVLVSLKGLRAYPEFVRSPFGSCGAP